MKRLSSFTFPHMTVQRLVTGTIEENAYLIRHESGDAVLIDPGDDASDLLELVKRSDARVLGILLTHAHFDHIGAVQDLREALQAPVYLHLEAWGPYSRAHLGAERWNLPFKQPAAPDHELREGDFSLGRLEFQNLFTPGHAPGHLAFYHASGFVISGDALFKGSVGRTDLPGSDGALLLERIRSQLYSLPEPTLVFSGHGEETSILTEKRTNPYARP